MNACPYCAEPLPAAGVDVCPYCGTDLTAPVSAPRPTAHTGAESAGMRMLLPVGRSGWAIAAGYLGLISVLGFPGPLAIICSVIAFRDLRKNKELHGMGRAIFGLIAGVCGTILLVLVLIVIAHGF